FTTGAGQDNGRHTFTVSLASVGQQSVTATTTGGVQGTQANINILPDPAVFTGDRLATAIPVSFTSDQTASLPGFLPTPLDVKLYALDLHAGDTVRATVTTDGSALDALLCVFDSAGRRIASNDNFDGNDPALTFQAADDGTYYVGVSAS